MSLLILSFFILLASAQSLDPSYERPVPGRDQQLIVKGISAAGNAARAMKVLQSIKVVSNIGAVLGPLMTVTGVAAEIAFLVMGVESEEMATMKREFAVVSNRLDTFSAEFGAVKRKIDWSSVQVAFARHEATVRLLNSQWEKLLTLNDSSRETQIKAFLEAYEFSFDLAGERLFLAMAGLTQESPVAHNLVEAARVFTRSHRRQTFEFVRGGVQLLVQAACVQVAYVTLRYNNPNATAFLKAKLQQRMEAVEENAARVLKVIKERYGEQAEEELAEMMSANHGESNYHFARRAHAFLTEKFDWRRWAVVSYPELSTYNEHAVKACGGGFIFRRGGRNLVWSSKAPEEGGGFTQPWAWWISSLLQYHRVNENQALFLFKIVEWRSSRRQCQTTSLVAIAKNPNEISSVADSEQSIFRTAALVYYCMDPACWFVGKKYYGVVLWG